MPDSMITKIEKLADRDWAANGISFNNIHKKSFSWKNEEQDTAQVEPEQNASPYPDLCAEFPEKVLLHDQQVPAIEEDEKKDDNEEVAATVQNYELGDLLQQKKTSKEKEMVIQKMILVNQRK